MTRDLRERLGDADPVRDLEHVRLDDELYDRLVVAIVDDHRGGRAPSRPRSVAVGVLTTAVAVAAILVLALTFRPTGPGSLDGASPAASSILVTSARHAVDEPASGSDYWQVVTRSPDRGVTRTEWVAVDGARPTVTEDEHSGRSVAWTSDLAPDTVEGSFLNPTPRYLQSLPRDPSTLRAVIASTASGHGSSESEEMFTVIRDLLRSGVVPADLRRSLFTVLDSVPGVDASPAAGGHSGEAVLSMRQEGAGLIELMVDTSTGSVVGTRVDGGAWSTTSVSVVPQIPAEVRSRAVVAHCVALAGSGMSCTGLPPDQP